MNRSALLPQVALVFAVAYACSDSTAPAISHALVTATHRSSVLGKPPPPPVATAINISVSSHPATGAFEGVYFNQGETAWLRLNNTQSDVFGTSASANARFKASGDRFTGMGTLMIDGQEVVITAVTGFIANPTCGTGDLCAIITFDATVDGEPGHHGTAQAFDREFCTPVFVFGESEVGHWEFSCPVGSGS